jgi:hypothetical protein
MRRGVRIEQSQLEAQDLYRYAFFEGDDPATPTDENFDMLLPGFYDWGTCGRARSLANTFSPTPI